MKTFKTFILEIYPWSRPGTAASIAKGKETMSQPVGKHHVRNKIHITFHDDRVDYHYGSNLVHSVKGDYSKPTKQHLAVANHKTAALYQKHRVK